MLIWSNPLCSWDFISLFHTDSFLSLYVNYGYSEVNNGFFSSLAISKIRKKVVLGSTKMKFLANWKVKKKLVWGQIKSFFLTKSKHFILNVLKKCNETFLFFRIFFCFAFFQTHNLAKLTQIPETFWCCWSCIFWWTKVLSEIFFLSCSYDNYKLLGQKETKQC